jgi:hypothetical protein
MLQISQKLLSIGWLSNSSYVLKEAVANPDGGFFAVSPVFAERA